MPDSTRQNPKNSSSNPRNLTPQQYKQLQSELKAPYRGLRQFVYIAFGASGLIGAVVFLAQLAGGSEISTALPNFALQVGIVALMVWLFRLEQRASRR